jgi:hypothetical protein
MNKRRESWFRFMGRARGRDEIDRVEMEASLRRLRHRDVAGVDGIESAAEQSDRAPMSAGV